MTGRILGGLKVQRTIGQGGSGSVYEAIDPKLDRRVAIKSLVLPQGSDAEVVRERFAREARITASLSHPNIVQIYNLFEEEFHLYLVMEFVSGLSLARLMTETAPGEWWLRFLPVLEICAGALDYVHQQGIVHGDIKPDNIMVQSDGQPKILDFGIARLAHQTSVTQTGTIVGTLSYLAPEVLVDRQISPPADQYALAVIAYQLATGVLPFAADSAAAMMYKVLQAAPTAANQLNPGISTRIASAIAKGLSKDPTQRFRSCQEFALELRAPTEAPTISPVPVQPLPPAPESEFTRFFRNAPAPPPVPSGKGETTAAYRVERPPAPLLPPPPMGSVPPAPVAGSTASQPAAAAAPSLMGRIAGWFGNLFSSRETNREEAPQQIAAPPPPPPAFPAPPPIPPAARAKTTAVPTPVPGRTPASYGGEQTMILRRPVDLRLHPQELARRQAGELVQQVGSESFESTVILEGKWLPGVEGADATLLAFREAARYLLAARTASSPHNAIEHLTRAEALLVGAGNQLLRSQGPMAAEMPAALEAWKTYTRGKLAEARKLMESQLPNPYRAGQPLRPDQGRVLFRGRDHIVRQIESILADGNQSGSIALLGPRRCGKTSLLQMLPALLPDCLCVFFDLQDNPVDSTQAFFQALERQVHEQSRRDRRVETPPLPDGGGFAAATQWFHELDRLPGGHRILLCLDEFERLEDLFPGNRQDLLRLMGLFRATIQHRRSLRLLVSGVAPFDELGQIWNDHFINVREIRIGHLDRDASLDLLMRPSSDFPDGSVPEAVAARVFERTGGQPYLLQLYGSLLIARLNQEQRRCAVIEDVAQIEQEAMSQGAYYFRHTYESAPDDSRRVLEELAAGRHPELPPHVHRWLSRRGLVAPDGSQAIPVLGAFMRDELSLQ